MHHPITPTPPPHPVGHSSTPIDPIRPNITQTTHPETENTISYTYNIHVLNVPDLLYSSRYRVVERNYVCARSCSSFSCCVVLFVVSCGITPLIPNHACITVEGRRTGAAGILPNYFPRHGWLQLFMYSYCLCSRIMFCVLFSSC